MKVEVLVASMHQNDHSLLKKMNINSNVIVGNQCETNSIEYFVFNGFNAIYLNFNERGVGLNRNNALMRSTSDICLIADDDMFFYDDYVDKVTNLFEKLKGADVLIFNLDEKNDNGRRKNKKIKRINIFNYMNYGAARFAFRRKVVTINGITFNLNYGGGTGFSSGEDSLFLRDCLRKKLKIYSVPVSLAKLLDNRESTWFKGYNEKFFFDKGFFLANAHPKLCRVFAFYLVFKHKKEWLSVLSYKKTISFLFSGIKEFKLKKYLKRD